MNYSSGLTMHINYTNTVWCQGIDPMLPYVTMHSIHCLLTAGRDPDVDVTDFDWSRSCSRTSAGTRVPVALSWTCDGHPIYVPNNDINMVCVLEVCDMFHNTKTMSSLYNICVSHTLKLLQHIKWNNKIWYNMKCWSYIEMWSDNLVYYFHIVYCIA